MIELTIEEFILWVVGVPIVAIGLYYCLSSLNLRNKKRSTKRQLIKCRACGYVFHDATREKAPVCPECGRQNGRGGPVKFG